MSSAVPTTASIADRTRCTLGPWHKAQDNTVGKLATSVCLIKAAPAAPSTSLLVLPVGDQIIDNRWFGQR